MINFSAATLGVHPNETFIIFYLSSSTNLIFWIGYIKKDKIRQNFVVARLGEALKWTQKNLKKKDLR